MNIYVCGHCGAAGGHGDDECPVVKATARILERPTPAPEGRLVINGSYVGRVDGRGGLESGELYTAENGVVRWVSTGSVTADRSR